MKTLLFTLEYPPAIGGVGNYYGNMVKHWPKGEDNILILDNNDGKLLDNRLPTLKWLPCFWYLWQTLRKEKDVKYIIVGQVLPLGTVTWFITRFIKIPYLVILHGTDISFGLRAGRKRWLTKLILRNADHIISCNQYVAKKVDNYFKDSRNSLVNPGIDINSYKPNPSLEAKLKEKYQLDSKITLFSIGRFVERKGFDKVIKSLHQVLPEVPNLKYFIAGRGHKERRLKELVASLKLDEKVIFLGKITDEEKWAWLSLADMFIMPSRVIEGDFEGFGIVYLEANLAGTPVIAGDSGGVRDAVEDGVNGLLVDPVDINSIAQGITRLAKDKNLRQKLGQQGRERAIEEFNWEKQARKIYKIIK